MFGDVPRPVFDMEHVNFPGILGKHTYIYICCFILNKVIRNKFEKICQFFSPLRKMSNVMALYFMQMKLKIFWPSRVSVNLPPFSP